ncbi:hypothetical protein AnigIFM63604_011899 [Aspergillus niger]|uniref:Contig An08c0140, genomic contig n=2 Tax=Aspergillus niger TaxID=5061 RepID=A2QRM9_ASPNC|nr:uncharacterized protein An08g06600 [Aspergillus niger]CAK45630.1 unnamed protein product [Aspergillus niger]GJP97515.1 unnamed protein product [Aspergillus niger]GKZ96657.1 hypothetical protein AnigIFM59636_011172 [Aspergillus niger]GLA24305.1 hypothetical protein AnigIFM63326_011163 [Aspergillus niger]GLA54363.1 hypothetical protein AnigIFM63604_011899 [Aspergillus niger]
MPANTRIQSSASKLHNLLVPRPPTPCLLPLRSIWQPAAIHTPRSVQARLNSGLGKDWKGTGAEDHAVDRTQKNDTTDPTTDASASVMQDRKEGEGNDAKPQGATEKGGSQHGKKAKQEHPKAPEPIIGMNDERGHVSFLRQERLTGSALIEGSLSPGLFIGNRKAQSGLYGIE